MPSCCGSTVSGRVLIVNASTYVVNPIYEWLCEWSREFIHGYCPGQLAAGAARHSAFNVDEEVENEILLKPQMVTIDSNKSWLFSIAQDDLDYN